MSILIVSTEIKKRRLAKLDEKIEGFRKQREALAAECKQEIEQEKLDWLKANDYEYLEGFNSGLNGLYYNRKDHTIIAEDLVNQLEKKDLIKLHDRKWKLYPILKL